MRWLDRCSSGRLLRVFALWAVCLGGSVSAQIVKVPPTVYLRGDSLFVDVVYDSLFSQRAQDAIASGMSTSIIHQFQLTEEAAATIVHSIVIQLDHDIWENRYTVTRSDSNTDTLRTDAFKDVEHAVTVLFAIPIGLIAQNDRPYTLSARSRVDLISPEQERRTRRWLNLLERGSILELFFSLDPREQDIPWSEIARFRRSDLPQEPPFAPPPEAPPSGTQELPQ